jgi:hypothetical protein
LVALQVPLPGLLAEQPLVRLQAQKLLQPQPLEALPTR